MKHHIIILLLLLSSSYIFPQKNSDYFESISIVSENSLDLKRSDEIVEISIKELQKIKPDFNYSSFVITSKQEELPSQLFDSNDDGIPDKILFIADFLALEKKELMIRFSKEGIQDKNYKKRTQAVLGVKTDYNLVDGIYSDGKFENVNEVIVPKNHEAHDALYRFEGPGWESDLVGYRFYLDSRNRTDIFGKKTNELVLNYVGMNDLVSDGKESYTIMSDWGMDIFKVGQSLGIGSIAMWYNNQPVTVSETDEVKCKITANGPIKSMVTTIYKNWKVGGNDFSLKADLSISAGSRLTKVDLQISNSDTMCTGIAKHENTQFIKSQEDDNEWGFIALYGKQTLADDNLGLAIFYRKSDLVKISEDNLNYFVIFYPDTNLTYYFAAAWEQEKNGIKSQKEFEKYLADTIQKLNDPIKVNLK